MIWIVWEREDGKHQRLCTVWVSKGLALKEAKACAYARAAPQKHNTVTRRVREIENVMTDGVYIVEAWEQFRDGLHFEGWSEDRRYYVGSEKVRGDAVSALAAAQ
jgi:hypothetical protein